MGTRKYQESWNIYFEGSGIISTKSTSIFSFIAFVPYIILFSGNCFQADDN